MEFEKSVSLKKTELVRQINSIFYWNLEIWFKVFFLIDSYSPDLAV